jgi:hypothetical protein
MDTPRDNEIHQAQEARAVKDTLILQKVNAAHREAFIQKFPGQCEHILRLIAERLQLGLRKDTDIVLTNEDVNHLAQALAAVYDVHCDLDRE